MTDKELFSTIKKIMKGGQTLHKKFVTIWRMAFQIFLKASDHEAEGKPREYTENESQFQLFMYSGWCFIGSKGVPLILVRYR